MELIHLNPADDVAVALCDLPAGSICQADDVSVRLVDDIAFGRKVALHDIAQGANILKYGCPIGHATKNIRAGELVHVSNLRTNLSGIETYQYVKAATARPENGSLQFDGYRRKNGTVGTRNELWIVPTVGCVNTTARLIAEKAKAKYGTAVDDVVAVTHSMGCSQLGDDQKYTMELLSGIIRNPNAGGVLVLSLGCENNNLDVFQPYLDAYRYDTDRLRFLVTQDADNEVDTAMELVDQLASAMQADHREPVPISELVIGFKCGGSDAFSGITANALCGRVTDKVTANGGTCILTEVPEMFGAETQLMARAKDAATFDKIVEMINGFKNYFTRHNQPIYENPPARK